MNKGIFTHKSFASMRQAFVFFKKEKMYTLCIVTLQKSTSFGDSNESLLQLYKESALIQAGKKKTNGSILFDDELRRIRLSREQGSSQTKAHSDLSSSSYFHQTTTQVPERFLERSDTYSKIVKDQHPIYVTQVCFYFSPLSPVNTWSPVPLIPPKKPKSLLMFESTIYLYLTANKQNAEYGRKAPEEMDAPLKWHGIQGKFTSQFSTIKRRDTGIDTYRVTSRIHQVFDDF